MSGSVAEELWKDQTKTKGNKDDAQVYYQMTTGQFMGKDFYREMTDKAKEVMQGMRYQEETCNWNWNKHTLKFQNQVATDDFYARKGALSELDDYVVTSEFLKTIDKDNCGNNELKMRVVQIHANRSNYSGFDATVLPFLMSTTKTPGNRSSQTREVAYKT